MQGSDSLRAFRFAQKMHKQVAISNIKLNMKPGQANQTILKAAKAQKLACSGRLLTDILA
jgi:hypothetical protein